MILFGYSITYVQYAVIASVVPLIVIQSRRLIFDAPGAGVMMRSALWPVYREMLWHCCVRVFEYVRYDRI